MYRMLFTNRWVALGFVALTALSAIALVGTDGHDGALTRAMQGVHEQQQNFDDQVVFLNDEEASPGRRPESSHSFAPESPAFGAEDENEPSSYDDMARGDPDRVRIVHPGQMDSDGPDTETPYQDDGPGMGGESY
ncbi:MAG: hypothetical protein PHE36_12575 [Novosphingobium sp.]|nr:hypothetical protein [Novosphingobium sp.]